MSFFNTQELLGMTLLCVVLAWQARRRAPFLLALTWGYFLVNTVRMAHVFRVKQGKYLVHVEPSSALGLILLILIPSIVWSLSREHRRGFMAGIACLLFLNLVPLALTVGHPTRMAFGIFNCESVDAGVMAAILPIVGLAFARERRSKWLLTLSFGIPLVAAVMTRTTTPFYILAATSGLLVLRMGWFAWPVAGVSAGGLLALGAAFANNGMLNTSGRGAAWELFMGWWRSFGNPWFGTGGGTFQHLGLLIQRSYPEKNAWPGAWLWMHNDWLQVLFEYGYLGLGLLGTVYLWALVRSFRRTWVFTGLLSFGLLAMAQFPMHWVLTQVWACLLLREAFDLEFLPRVLGTRRAHGLSV